MRRAILPLLSIILMFCLTYCKKSSSTPPESSQVTELEGTRTGIELDRNTNRIYEFKSLKLETNSDGYSATCTFSIDTSKTPKQLDLSITSCTQSQLVGQVSYCIYVLDADVLNITAGEPDSQIRPFTIGSNRTWILNKQP
jgi:uncharacterized protein (TIGR03067 family)